MPSKQKQAYPIIYVRGYAMTQSEIGETTSTPYMGFELGSTKSRQQWDRSIRKLFFESPIVRLRKDYDYVDIYKDGIQLEEEAISPSSIIIHRYYDRADPDFGGKNIPTIEEAAAELSDLILRTRRQVCASGKLTEKDFRVYLVAHSMGGLVCRCFLQNEAVGSKDARNCVDKVFTFATPHNGINMAGLNVPRFFSLWDMNNFSHSRMRKYLAIDDDKVMPRSLNGQFDSSRFFCLIGTNSKDYSVAGGALSMLAGELSDGLVRIENAYVQDAPRAFVYRSHSGTYGIVNSEEGYQNLTRFLFGDVVVDGLLQIEALPLPPLVQGEVEKGETVKVGYYFEVAVSVRGAMDYDLTRRTIGDQSAVQRTREELVDLKTGALRPDARHPQLFSIFLDSTKRPPRRREMVFTVQLAVSTSSYQVGEKFFSKFQIPGEYLFRNTILISAIPPGDAAEPWKVRYVLTDDEWSSNADNEAVVKDAMYRIPISNPKGFKATLVLTPRAWV